MAGVEYFHHAATGRVQWESPCNEPGANLAQESSSSSPALRGGDACTNSTLDNLATNSTHDNSAQEGANSEKNAAFGEMKRLLPVAPQVEAKWRRELEWYIYSQKSSL